METIVVAVVIFPASSAKCSANLKLQTTICTVLKYARAIIKRFLSKQKTNQIISQNKVSILSYSTSINKRWGTKNDTAF